MVSGPDVITYIGVPLAVLGVLPIIYNTVSTLATLAKVRRLLRHGRLAGIARGDVINHVIEVELPRYTLAPLDRDEHRRDYWSLYDYPSPLPGGSWTIFNWRSHSIGIKTQRIDYADQLRQPQAEIGFEELISFLLDLGAVPDPTGIRLLRGSGLWAPAGTRLLVSPDGQEPVLSMAPLDDSDGHLSLAVRWSSNWGMRDSRSLPPYWVLIHGEIARESVTSTETVAATDEEPEKEGNEKEDKDTQGEEQPKQDVNLLEDAKSESTTANARRSSTQRLRPRSTSKYIPETEDQVPAVRCQIGVDGLVAAVPDDNEQQMFDKINVSHLVNGHNGTHTTATWFASAITAYGTTSATILWNYKIPTETLDFAKKSSIPCGVLVLLDLVPESATPEWATVYDDAADETEARMRKLREQSRAMLQEQSMSPADRAKAVRERQLKAHDDFVQEMRDRQRLKEKREEQRMLEALSSRKWDNRLVADHSLTWLKQEGHLDSSYDLKRAVELLLWRMVVDVKVAADIGGILDFWKSFVDNGGVRKADVATLREGLVSFAWASIVLSIIEDSVSAVNGSLAADLQECLRIWRKVRLG
ncbi:hypothetical protein F5884DRAFT_521408 [Xylogone sp. PMI_703]|nr:hypothetical protein F5884DRAFT_521408 [Xylogone sp. PMI_703]